MLHALLLVALLAGCAARATSPATVDPSEWRYEVVLEKGAEELAIQASFPSGSHVELVVRDGAQPFVHDVEIEDGARWSMLDPRNGSWFLLDDDSSHRIRYRFFLKDACDKLRDPDVAAHFGDAFVASPSVWLLHPSPAGENCRFRVHVSSPSDLHYVSGVFPARSGEPGVFAGDASDLQRAPPSALGRMRVVEVSAQNGAKIELAVASISLPLEDKDLARWLERAVRAIEAYYGAFPLPHAAIIVTTGNGSGVGDGRTLCGGGVTSMIRVGRRVRASQLDADWVLTHEMVHMTLPSLPMKHHWLEEGIATYVEPIARAQAGQETATHAWRDLVENLPQGLPQDGDRGLDNTRTWGRTYYGGALYCLLADIEIRKRTQDKKGLQDALAGIVEAGGNIGEYWDIERVLAVGDEAVGVPVMTETWQRLANEPVQVDLGALWKELGISMKGRSLEWDDSAPGASARKAITQPRQ